MSKLPVSDVANHRAATGPAELPHSLSNVMNTIENWMERRRQRQALAALEDHLLDDVGLSREQARREAAKPFWKS